MATSAIEICNVMLSFISRRRIVSFDDNTKESNFCKSNYNPARRAVLEAREWSFASRRELLPPLAATPIYGYAYKFLVPSTYLRILGVYDPADINNKDAETISHRVEIDVDNNKVILADISSIHVRYIYDQTKTELFSPLFDQCLAAYMGYLAAIPLTQDKDQQSRLFGIYKDMLDEATFNDSLQGTRDKLKISQLEQIRRLYTRPY